MPAIHGREGESVTYRQQFTRCGKAVCRRCSPGGSGHGPYWYAYWREGGRLRSRYVGKEPPAATVAVDAPVEPTSTVAADAALPPLRVRTLGPLVVWRGAAPIPAHEWKRRKAMLLFALVLISPGMRLHRDRASDTLWPDATPQAATINLRTTLHLLRKILDPPEHAGGYIRTDGEWIVLEPAPGASPDPDWWDVEAFSRAAGQALASDSADRCRVALQHYHGDLLVGYPHEDWLLDRRESLRRRRLAVLEHLATLSARHDDLPEALRALELVLESEPCHEEAARLQMRILAGSGQRTGALRAYQRLADALARDLEVTPDAETVALQAAIALGEREERAAEGSQLVQPPIDALLATVRHTPLVGRVAELSGIGALRERVRGGAGEVAFISGATGAGKTRLLDEALREARAQGMLVLWGRAYHAEGRLPFGALLDAMRRYVAAQPAATLARQLGTVAPVIVSFLPELAALATAPPPPPLDPGAARHRLFAAIASWLRTICGEVPVVLALDDLQWADTATIQLLHYLARSCRDVPLLLLGAYREEDLGAGALAQAVSSLERERAISLALPPLGARETRTLATALLAPYPPHADVLALICEKAHGNPLVLDEMVAQLRDGGWIALRDGLWVRARVAEVPAPEGVRSRLAERLRRLDPAAIRLLRICAVLGVAPTYPLLQAVCGMGEEELLDALDATEGAGILEATASGYRFHHPLQRAALHDSIPAPRRAFLHRTVGEALARHVGERGDEHAATLAWHFAQSGDHARAWRYGLRAAGRAATLYANAEAIAHLVAAREHLLLDQGADSGALRSLDEQLGDVRQRAGDFVVAGADYARARGSTTDPARLVVLWQKEGATLDGCGAYDGALEAYDRAAAEAASLPNAPALLASLAVGRGSVHYRRGEYAAAEAAATRSLDLEAADTPIAARACNLLGNVARARNDPGSANRWHRRALAIWERWPEADRDPQALLGVWGNLGITAFTTGRLDEAEVFHATSLAIAERIGDQRAIAYSRYNLAMIHADRGDLASAADYHRQSLETREALEDRFNAAFSLEGLGKVAHLRGDLALADDFYGRALAIWEGLGAMASTIHALGRRGEVACERGDLAGAAAFFRRARERERRQRITIPALRFMQAARQLRAMEGARPVSGRHATLAAALIAAGVGEEHAAGSTRHAASAALLSATLAMYIRAPANGDDEPGTCAVRSQAEEALHLATAAGRRREMALAHRLLARCALAEDDRGAALAHLDTAVEMLKTIGAALELERTRALRRTAQDGPPDGPVGRASIATSVAH